MSSRNKYETGLDRNPANYTPLTPLTFIRRTAEVFPDHPAVIYGDVTRSWAATYERCIRLASALAKRGIGRGDTVALMAANTPEALEAHFGVPMSGAVLNALNYRQDAANIAYILEHGEAKLFIADREFSPIISEALEQVRRKPVVVNIDDPQGQGGQLLGSLTYEDFLEEGDRGYAWPLPEDEWQAISLNYTSGTTGHPKGVVYHHRGACLNAIGNVTAWAMPHHPRYLWTLPMFHCNGWCFPWTITAMAGTHICLRRVDARAVYKAIATHDVTHMCGAPIVMGMLVNAATEDRRALPGRVSMMTAGAAPPAAILEKMEGIGFDVTHVYGLTEVYGPAVVCPTQERWQELAPYERAVKHARQGVPYLVLQDLTVADPETLAPVPRDGQTMGEVLMRGNVVMKGYLKNPAATVEAFKGGWFRSGDLGVMHTDGYIELKDRSKDIIISGGENISTIEVEGVLYRHPAVAEAAVVARPDEKWGETPCAFVTLKSGQSVSEEELIVFCRANLAHFKCPKTVVFSELPKTSTGKIQKFVLREQAKQL